MFCSGCGKELPDSVAYCTECGAKLREENSTYINGHPSWTRRFNPVQPAQPVLPMNWYKFLINFSLFAGAVLNLIMGILNFAGNSFIFSGSDLEMLYSAHEGLRVLDIGYGIVYIALIPFILYVRFAFSGFKKDAPNVFYIYCVADYIISVSYTIFSSIVTDGSFSLTVGQIIGDVAGVILYIALNMIYFNKRKHLFVN